MDISEYLERKGLGYELLSDSERISISNFSLIWSLFEAQLLEENASAKKIIAKCSEWNDQHGIDEKLVDDHLAYFQNRYIENGESNDKYDNLNLRKNDEPNLILSVLKGENNDLQRKLASCLIIILRFRNNYFHGIKWAYKFADQKDNFDRSCNLLTVCLDKYAH
jgi:hypothetical protein